MEETKFKAILVGVNYKDMDYNIDISMNELKQLAEAVDIEVVDTVVQNLNYIHEKYYIGPGKMDDVKMLAKGLDANLVIMNEELTPSQLTNLEKHMECEVIDRTFLILEIFARRAKTNEAKLQVEIAKLQYILPRLIGMDESIYSEQGGKGFRGGGETLLEVNRRRIKKDISLKRHELEEMVKQRQVQREKRKKHDVPVVALVGYTNSGKSSLMNRFMREYSSEEKQVFAKDMLFATLETSTRSVILPNKKQFLLTDTVGFVNQLPHHLVKAFRSTLEEVREADLLVHVIDGSNKFNDVQIEVTNKVLEEIGVKDIPMIYVFNKMDICETVLVHREDCLFMSVLKDENLNPLIEMICSKLFNEKTYTLFIPYASMATYSYLKDHSEILREEAGEEGYSLDVKLSEDMAKTYKDYIVHE